MLNVSEPLLFLSFNRPGVPESIVVGGGTAAPFAGNLVFVAQFNMEVAEKQHSAAAVTVGNGFVNKDTGEGFHIPGGSVGGCSVFTFRQGAPGGGAAEKS